MAEVNDKGEVNIEGEFIGRLEGFRFQADKTESTAEAKALSAASITALAPEFHLRADRFYNAPDTDIDYTEQGGLMWGNQAVGKLVKGDDALKPRVQAFVDDAAGADVAEKVTRRLQHFIDRKVATLFEPMLAMSRDETLEGLARGFAFRLVELMGITPRADVATEVKDLEQDMRGALRKHGVRFGQFTIFMPLMLKPAPTRLRLVLAGLFSGAQEFDEAPPPGLVTIPSIEGISTNTYRLSGYRKAGARAIRIDMLERLADQLRAEDSRGGFEANPDMLSITGMSLEQFADLLQGLGYKAAKGERLKVKAAPEAAAKAEETPKEAPEETATEDAPKADAPVVEAVAKTEAVAADAEAKPEKEPENEVFYTFTWGGFGAKANPRGKPADGKPQGRRKGKPGQGQGKGRGDKGGKKPSNFNARPPKKEKAIDPDNPFAAALMGLKGKS